MTLYTLFDALCAPKIVLTVNEGHGHEKTFVYDPKSENVEHHTLSPMFDYKDYKVYTIDVSDNGATYIGVRKE